MSYAYSAISGVLVIGAGEEGTNRKQIYGPGYLYFGPSTNSLVIVNHETRNIIRWVLGANNGTLVGVDSYRSSGSTSNLLFGLKYMTFDSMSNVYAADRNSHRIEQVFRY
jgi:altronate dehydratase